MTKKRLQVTIGRRKVALSPEYAIRVNSQLAEFLRFEAAIKSLVNERWLPKFMRRTGLPVYWAWAHELTISELIALMVVLTETGEEFLTAASSENCYEDLLNAFEQIESARDVPARAKRRRVVVVLGLLLALAYSCRSIGFYSLSVNELVRKGLNGNALALRQAISVDPSVLTMPSVASYVGSLQLADERKELASLLRAAIKGPNKQLQPNWQLRYMERVLREGKTAEAYGKDALYELITQRLKLYDTRGADPFKGLFTTFQRWQESATT